MNPHPIGVFDSGVGGLTVFRALAQCLPGERFIYLGDTARVPYGTKSPETIVRYTLQAARFFEKYQVKLLVVACNTASSLALAALADTVTWPVIGVIAPGARRAVEASAAGRIGVIGTRATIGSGAYAAAIRDLRPEAEVLSHACPLFVPLAEEGWSNSEIARQVALRYLAPFMGGMVDTLVLGCTHYPLLREVIADVVGPGVTLVDSAEAVSEQVRQHLAQDGELGKSEAGHLEHRFYVTDDPAPFQEVAERFLGRPIRLERAQLVGD